MHTKSLDENLSFESLLGDLSAKLVNLPLESIDSTIEHSMKTLEELEEKINKNIVDEKEKLDEEK